MFTIKYLKRNPVKIIALSNSVTLKLSKVFIDDGQTEELQVEHLYYARNTDPTYTKYTLEDEITLAKDEYVSFWNQDVELSKEKNNYVHFVITGQVKLMGDIKSFFNYSEVMPMYGCYGLFENCDVIDVEDLNLSYDEVAWRGYSMMFANTKFTGGLKLPATILNPGSYYGILSGNTNLVDPPELPATSVPNYCYSYMFAGCTALSSSPELPAMNLAIQSYDHMFNNAGIVVSPVLPATTTTETCYRNMFEGCTALSAIPELPATTVGLRSYWEMFKGCTGLTEVNNISATTISTQGCFGMFKGCTGLTSVQDLTADTLSEACYESMFEGCTSLVNPPALPSMNVIKSCYRYMFKDCTSLTSAPELPGNNFTSNQNYCYQGMFMNCSNLTYIKVGYNDARWLNGYTKDWVVGVASSGTFIKPESLETRYGTDWIPNNWTVQNI